MSKLRLKISMSLDGFVAGPNQSVDNPIGIGGMRLHEWAFALAIFRDEHGMEGGEINASTPIVEESLANIGATVMGRNMFGGHPGGWNAKKPWNGWWGNNPPFHHPVFVLTHHKRAPLVLEGGTTFTFVTNGIEAALEQARRAAGGKDVSLAGSQSRAAVPRRRPRGRDGDQPRADATRQRRAAFRRNRRRSARAGARTDRRRAAGNTP